MSEIDNRLNQAYKDRDSIDENIKKLEKQLQEKNKVPLVYVSKYIYPIKEGERLIIRLTKDMKNKIKKENPEWIAIDNYGSIRNGGNDNPEKREFLCHTSYPIVENGFTWGEFQS